MEMKDLVITTYALQTVRNEFDWLKENASLKTERRVKR